MRFSKYKSIFMILSLVALVTLYALTFLKFDGFAHSITFDGGIRFSLNLPPGLGKTELEAALNKANLKDYQVRLVSLKTNQYDLEFGPGVHESISATLRGKKNATPVKKDSDQKSPDNKESDRKTPIKKNPQSEKKSDSAAGKKSDVKKTKKKVVGNTVVDEIERRLLEVMPELNSESIISREAISASYGGNLAGIASWSLFIVVLVIGLYLTYRFKLPFAIGASLALMHDILMTIGFIGVARIEPSIPVVAAVLTIIGYSINDTIVIFDRIRDSMEERKGAPLVSTMDLAITQTLSRTVVTSLLTLLAVLALLFGGAVTLHDFAKVLLFGVIIGTYSSIFIASHFVQYYEKFRGRL